MSRAVLVGTGIVLRSSKRTWLLRQFYGTQAYLDAVNSLHHGQVWHALCRESICVSHQHGFKLQQAVNTKGLTYQCLGFIRLQVADEVPLNVLWQLRRLV